MARKSILIIGSYPPPFGGVGRLNEDLVPYLVQQGWDVHVLVLSAGANTIEKHDGFTIYRENQTRLRRVINLAALLPRITIRKPLAGLHLARCVPLRNWLFYMSCVAVASQIVERHQVRLICAYKLHSGAPVGAVLSELHGVSLIVNNFGEILSMAGFFKTHEELVRYICRVATKLISMTCHCAESYKRIGMSPEVNVLPVGVDINKF